MSNEQSIRDELVDRINDELDKWGEGSPSPYAIADAISPVIRSIQAEALREATRVFAEGGWVDTFTAGVVDDVTAVQAADRWFNDRADAIERGETA